MLCEDWPADRADHDPALVGELPREVRVLRLPNRRPQGFVEKVLIHKLSTYLAPQRAPVLWWREAIGRARALLREQEFHAIWATSDPLVTLDLAARTPFCRRAPAHIGPFARPPASENGQKLPVDAAFSNG